MPLGKQFKNTYFVNEQGETVFHTPNSGETDPKVRPAPKISPAYSVGTSYQGMLFDPHWGTGSSQDPSISTEERHAAIDKVLGTGDVEAFRRVNGPLKSVDKYRHKTSGEEVDLDQMSPEDKANPSKNYRQLSERAPRVSAARAAMQIEGVRKAAVESGIPHQEWVNLAESPVGIEVRPPQKTWGGHYNTGSGNITLNERTTSEWVPTKEKPALPPAKRGAPIPNPNWRAQTEALGEVYEEWPHRRLFTEGITGHMEDRWGTGRDRNPENMPRTPQQAVAPTYFDEHGNATSTPDDHHYLPVGYSANIFPGKGASTKDYIATPIKTVIENPFTYRNKTLWYHLRHEAVPDPTGEVAEPKQPKTKRVIVSSGVNEGTLTHELGHSIDPNIRDLTMSHPDPIQEGAADGYQDRHHNYRDAYAEALDPSRPSRALELQAGGGYGANYFKGRTGGRVASAAYIAARAHVSMGEHNMSTIPNRRGLWEGQTDGMYADDAARKQMTILSLGHLYHHHEHVRQALASTGYEAEGQAAHKAWAETVTDGAKDTKPVPHSTLFDL